MGADPAEALAIPALIPISERALMFCMLPAQDASAVPEMCPVIGIWWRFAVFSAAFAAPSEIACIDA